jgi:hypothetical protein
MNMELAAIIGLIVGLTAGTTGAIKKCEADPAWCKKAAAQISPAPEQLPSE